MPLTNRNVTVSWIYSWIRKSILDNFFNKDIKLLKNANNYSDGVSENKYKFLKFCRWKNIMSFLKISTWINTRLNFWDKNNNGIKQILWDTHKVMNASVSFHSLKKGYLIMWKSLIHITFAMLLNTRWENDEQRNAVCCGSSFTKMKKWRKMKSKCFLKIFRFSNL